MVCVLVCVCLFPGGRAPVLLVVGLHVGGPHRPGQAHHSDQRERAGVEATGEDLGHLGNSVVMALPPLL